MEGARGPLTFAAGAFGERDLGVLRTDQRERTGVRGAFGAVLPRGVEVAGRVLHVRNEARVPDAEAILFAGLVGNPSDDPVGRGYVGNETRAQRDSLGVVQGARRTVASVSARVALTPAISLEGLYGIDRAVADEERLLFREERGPEGTYTETGGGVRTRRTAGVEARARLGDPRGARFTTALGAERESDRRLREVTTSLGPDFPASSSSTRVRRQSVGIYAVQEVAWRDRFTASAVLRTDDHETFDDRVRSGSVAAAWDVLRGAERRGWLGGVRLRGAFGQTERFPDAGALPLSFIPIGAFPCGPDECPVPGPETVAEAEAGVDAELFGGAVELSLTGYDRATRDLLLTRALFDNALRVFNGGRATNRGVEGSVRVRGTAGGAGWTVEALGSLNRNRYEADGDETPVFIAQSQEVRDGEPLGAFNGRRVTGFQDRDGDGVIGAAGCPGAQCEVQVGEREPLGSPDPTRMLALRGEARAFGVRVSALLDHQGGAHTADVAFRARCRLYALCREVNDPSTPLAGQALGIAVGLPDGMAPVRSASFTRLREAALTAGLPAAWARRMGGREVSLTVAGRNLAIWTSYPGLDPEVDLPAAALVREVYNDLLPLPRTLVTRLDVRF